MTQLEIEFTLTDEDLFTLEGSVELPIGTIEEAQELYDCVGDRSYVTSRGPAGWEYLGRGAQRSAWLSPSGVVYKVCHRYYAGEGISSNDVEHMNFKYIRKTKKLKEGWRVPKSHLHVFNRRRRGWSYDHGNNVDGDQRIAIIAMEYVNGTTWDMSYATDSVEAMGSVGLNDAYSGNTMMGVDGSKWIVDAAEHLLDMGSNE